MMASNSQVDLPNDSELVDLLQNTIVDLKSEQDRLRKDLVATWQTLTQREAFLQDLLQKEQAERDKVEQKNFILLQALEVLGSNPQSNNTTPAAVAPAMTPTASMNALNLNASKLNLTLDSTLDKNSHEMQSLLSENETLKADLAAAQAAAASAAAAANAKPEAPHKALAPAILSVKSAATSLRSDLAALCVDAREQLSAFAAHHRRSVEGLNMAMSSIGQSAVKMVQTLEARDKKLSEISRQEHLKRTGGARQHVLALFPRQRLRLIFRLSSSNVTVPLPQPLNFEKSQQPRTSPSRRRSPSSHSASARQLGSSASHASIGPVSFFDEPARSLSPVQDDDSVLRPIYFPHSTSQFAGQYPAPMNSASSTISASPIDNKKLHHAASTTSIGPSVSKTASPLHHMQSTSPLTVDAPLQGGAAVIVALGDEPTQFVADDVVPPQGTPPQVAASLHPTIDAIAAGLDACVVFRGKPVDGSLLFKRAETALVISELVASLFERLSALPPGYTFTVTARIVRVFQNSKENLVALLLGGGMPTTAAQQKAQNEQDAQTGIKIADWAAFQALMRKVQTLLHQLSLLEQSSFRSSWLHHILMTFDVNIEIPLIRHSQKARLMLVDLAWVSDPSEMAVTKLQARASDLVNEDLNDILEYMRLASSSNTRHPPSSSSVTQLMATQLHSQRTVFTLLNYLDAAPAALRDSLADLILASALRVA